ncbi:MAG TPA: hypothetical protein VH880_08645, partial [Anaeromyxobacteraceae bacterium]
AIPIEERGGDEVAVIAGQRIAPEGVPARYPAFDVTPAALVTAVITERGVARAPLREALAEMARAIDRLRSPSPPQPRGSGPG